MDFMLGCNYWASNAGTEMWRNFDMDAIEQDLKVLTEHGVGYLRVFPNWRDFQPIMPLYAGGGNLKKYLLEGDREPENPYYLDEIMLSRFSDFLNICDRFGVKLIVGLITGWMSGRLFVPSALYGKNVITDPLAQHFEQLFIKGFVGRFRDSQVIYAWDLGNECNCMAPVENRWQAVNWTGMIANAIRASDPDRPVISGMHGLSVNDKWNIQDQGMYCDMLTTHPYPYFCRHTRNDKMLSLRTTMHATAESKFYSELSKKPCFAEEIGTLGPMFCSDEHAADFLRVNLFSLWANGTPGVLWWCGHDQGELKSYPYLDNMVEVELGMLRKDREPKPVILEMKKFAQWLRETDLKLPMPKTDAVCLLSNSQDQWGVGYMTYVLMRQIGLNCQFAYCEDGIPDSDFYLMPSVNDCTPIHRQRYQQLKEKVYQGADLYLSLGDSVLEGFESLVGMKILDACEKYEVESMMLGSREIAVHRKRKFYLESAGAEILAWDNSGDPILTVNRYGKGRVFYLNFPLEQSLINGSDVFDRDPAAIYRTLFGEYLAAVPLKTEAKNVAVTWHPVEDGAFAVLINHSDQAQELELKLAAGYRLERVYFGDGETIQPWNACVIKLVRER